MSGRPASPSALGQRAPGEWGGSNALFRDLQLEDGEWKRRRVNHRRSRPSRPSSLIRSTVRQERLLRRIGRLVWSKTTDTHSRRSKGISSLFFIYWCFFFFFSSAFFVLFVFEND